MEKNETTEVKKPTATAGKRKLLAYPKASIRHWLHWLVTLAISILGGCCVITILRSQPESLHRFFLSLPGWIRVSFIFALCIIVAYLAFRLFLPRLRHLRYLCKHPPTWLACLVAVPIVATIDLAIGLSLPKQKVSSLGWLLPSLTEPVSKYQASPLEWIGYAGGAIVLVIVYHLLTTWPQSPGEKIPPTALDLSKWPLLEVWLKTDAPSQYDIFDALPIADRIEKLLATETRSIGIIGPFGAGKSNIIEWMTNSIERNGSVGPRILLSSHSCWGFENSATAIHAMLRDGIKRVAEDIDTFQVSSLPESYRQTFSAGGQWIDNVTKLVFRQRDPLDQFKSLCDLLHEMNAKLVFIVEDLDRNNSRSFDVQEVLAFLQQLKRFDRLSFILTGGFTSTPRIDFAKLCDHVEYLRPIAKEQSSTLVSALRSQCLSQKAFSHEILTQEHENEWTSTRYMLLSDRDDIWPPDAVARLLNTPRSLRHALSRTYKTWQVLHGECDWDHLFALNVLRFAAPEAFSFILRQWHRLHDRPTGYARDRGELTRIRGSLKEDWDATVEDVDWDTRAARTLIDFILPATPAWMDDDHHHSGDGRNQGIQYEKYWIRAINEFIREGEIRDQDVAQDFRSWCDCPREDAALVKGICSNLTYAAVCEDLAYSFLQSDSSKILLLSEQVIRRIEQLDGARATYGSTGFASVWRYAHPRVPRDDSSRQWLEERLREAAAVSLELFNHIWQSWGCGEYSIIQPEYIPILRHTRTQILQSQITSAEHLERIVHENSPYGLVKLVFDTGNDNSESNTDLAEWRWLVPILLDSLRRQHTVIAVGVASLVSTRDSGTRSEPSYVDQEVLLSFFGERAQEVVDLLGELAEKVSDPNHRMLVDAIVKTGRVALAGRESGGSSPESIS